MLQILEMRVLRPLCKIRSIYTRSWCARLRKKNYKSSPPDSLCQTLRQYTQWERIKSEIKTRTTWERGRWRRENCLSPAPARFSHFLLLNDFPPLSRSLEQARGAVNHLPKKFLQVAQIFTKQQKRNETHMMQQHRPYQHMKVPRYSFSGSIPNKHLEKLPPQLHQIKDENLS